MKILYVEDDQLLKEVMTDILNTFGYETDNAGNGYEALQALGKNHYDIIIMDLNMPVLTGLETAKIISEKFFFKQRPKIIIMSGNNLDALQFFENDINDFIQKPFSISDIQDILSKWEKRIAQDNEEYNFNDYMATA